jgi:hypothetical protein
MSIIGKPVESVHAHGSQPSQSWQFYDLVEFKKISLNVNFGQTWTMDEHEVALAKCTNQWVVGDSGKTKTHIHTPENREWVSIVENISDAREFTWPAFVFKGVHIRSNQFDHSDDLPD